MPVNKDELITAMLNRAKINLQDDGHLTPCALLMGDEGLIAPIVVSWKDDNTK